MLHGCINEKPAFLRWLFSGAIFALLAIDSIAGMQVGV